MKDEKKNAGGGGGWNIEGGYKVCSGEYGGGRYPLSRSF